MGRRVVWGDEVIRVAHMVADGDLTHDEAERALELAAFDAVDEPSEASE